MATDDERKAKIAVNDMYQKAVNSILALSTAALVLPIVFFRDVVGITGKNVVGGYLHGIISSWIPLVNGSPKPRRWAGRLKIAAPLTNIFLVTAECWGHGGPSGLSFLRRERSVSRYETMDRYTAQGTEGRNK